MPNVVSCNEDFTNRSAGADVNGAQVNIEYTRNFIVVLDNGGPGAEVAVLYCGGLPILRDGHPFDPYSRVKSLRCSPEGDDDKVWHVDVAYSTDTAPEDQQPENPLDEPPQIEWSFQQFQRVADKDINGKPIVNSAKEQFDPLPEIDDSRLVLRFSRNEPYFPVNLAMEYQDAVNSDSWNGASAGKVKCQNIGASKQYKQTQDGTIVFYHVSYEFHFRYDDWDLHILNQGYRTTLGTDGYTSVTDDEGKALNQPVLLDNDGQELTSGADPIFKDFTVYRKLPFSTFNITL